MLRLLRIAKRRGITTMCTSLLPHGGGDIETTALPISTIADVWIHLSYVIRAGERNHALTVVKARGTRHSAQVRELVLGAPGLDLVEVSTMRGEVLMGTARWEQEEAPEPSAPDASVRLSGGAASCTRQPRRSRPASSCWNAGGSGNAASSSKLSEEAEEEERRQAHLARALLERRRGHGPR